MKHFNLLDEPWIRVQYTDGIEGEISLLGAFDESASIRAIRGEIASQDAAILRLLLAILHRAVDGPQTTEEWSDAWENPDRVLDDVRGYLEVHRERFELCAGGKPFYQVAGLTTAKGIPSALDALIVDVPNGSKLFTSRLAEGIERIAWGEGARWLVHAHAFDPSGIRSGALGDPRVKGGKVYPQGTGWAGQLGLVVIRGNTLYETLMLNLVVPGEGNDIDPVHSAEDLPPWERGQLGPGVEGDGNRQPTGPVDCYTWQGRRLRLVGDEEWVTGVVLCQGDRITAQNRVAVEPMTAWRYSEPQTKKLGATVYMPRKHTPERAFWRGLSAVVAQDGGTNSGKGVPQWRVPANIASFQNLVYEERIPERLLVPIEAIGVHYGTQESTVEELLQDVLLVPRAVLDLESPSVELAVRDCISAADAVASQLRNLAANLARAAGNDLVDGVGDEAGAQFFRTVDRPFREWLTTVSTDVDSAKRVWMETLRGLGESQADQMIAEAPGAAFAGRPNGSRHLDAGLAEVWFRTGLRKAIPLAFPGDTTNRKGDVE